MSQFLENLRARRARMAEQIAKLDAAIAAVAQVDEVLDEETPPKPAAKQPAPRREPSKPVEVRSAPRGPSYDVDEFERAWNAAANIGEVATRLGITTGCAQQRANMLRLRGRELQRFAKGARKPRTKEPEAQAADEGAGGELTFDDATRTLTFPDGTTKRFSTIAAGRAYAEAEAAKLGVGPEGGGDEAIS